MAVRIHYTHRQMANTSIYVRIHASACTHIHTFAWLLRVPFSFRPKPFPFSRRCHGAGSNGKREHAASLVRRRPVAALGFRLSHLCDGSKRGKTHEWNIRSTKDIPIFRSGTRAPHAFCRGKKHATSRNKSINTFAENKHHGLLRIFSCGVTLIYKHGYVYFSFSRGTQKFSTHIYLSAHSPWTLGLSLGGLERVVDFQQVHGVNVCLCVCVERRATGGDTTRERERASENVPRERNATTTHCIISKPPIRTKHTARSLHVMNIT